MTSSPDGRRAWLAMGNDNEQYTVGKYANGTPVASPDRYVGFPLVSSPLCGTELRRVLCVVGNRLLY